MSRYIDADVLEPIILWQDYEGYVTAYSDAEIENAPSIDLADYVPKDFHDKTCEAMAKAHQEEIADILERADADRPQGTWFKDDEGTFICSACGSGYKDQPTIMGKPMFEWCPICGARMKGADDE